MRIFLNCLIIISLIGSVKSLQAQHNKDLIKTFDIVSKADMPDLYPYVSALTNADMNNYRLLNKRVNISFDNGIIVELYSAKELLEKGMKINTADFNEDFPAGFALPQFSLGPNGYIIANYPARITK